MKSKKMNKNGKTLMLNLYLFLFLNKSCCLTHTSEISGMKSSSDKPHNINVFDIACDVTQKKTARTDRWNSSLFIDSKLGAAQAPGDECASGSACLCFLTPVHLWRRDRQRGFLYASFTLQTHHNSVVFQSVQSTYVSNSSPGLFSYDSLTPAQVLINDDCSVWFIYLFILQ